MKRVTLLSAMLTACGAGDGPAAPSAASVPAEAPAPPAVVRDPAVAPPHRLALGHHFACVVRDARVLCVGEAPSARSPRALAPVPWVDDVVEVAADDYELCARRADGTVRCAHADDTPFDVAGIDDAVRIRLDMSLVVQRADGTLVEVSMIDEHERRPIPGPGPAAAAPLDATADLAASFGRVCALGAHGRVACADDRGPDVHEYVERGAQAITIDNGVLVVVHGDGTVGADMLNDERYELRPRDALAGLADLRGACGFRDGAAVCPSFDGRSWRRLPEARVEGMRLVEVERDFDAGFAIDAAGELYVWGAPAPVIVTLPQHEPRGPTDVAGLVDAVAVSVADDHACALREGARVSCWGESFGPRPREVSLDLLEGAPAELVSGRFATCARSATGRVVCWGRRGVDGAAPAPFAPTRVDVEDARALAGAGSHMCARLGSGAVTCWAMDPEMQPAAVATLAGASAIGGGTDFVCGLVAGSLRCASFDTLFGGAPEVPVPRTEVGAVDELAVGGESACWRRGETWRCIGHNGVGQLGAEPSRPLAAPVDFPSGVAALALSYHRTCGVGARGAVTCAGTERDGSPRVGGLGRGSGALTALGAVAPARAVAVGRDLACALLEGGSVRCWGDGFEGGLGDGTSAILEAPVLIPVASP